MFVRKVSVRLKTDGAGEFIRRMETEIIPLLRKQQGFLDELTLISQSGREVYAYSFWENTADAEKYEQAAFPQATAILAGVVEGVVRIHTYMVANSTFHKLASAAS